ncbi:oxidoreductase [Salmonella enterica subsp. enterica]|uniref:Oxidoreductase n=1 Tax=Salmonella enterica I TaxID=59201 RepID=A0A379WBW9_SALET|nr:oxidoreductase [Salmonella enterica subsp. enterica]
MWLASQPGCDHLPSGRAYNITNGENRTLRSIVQKLIDELSIDCRIRSVPYPMLDMDPPAVWSASAKIRQRAPANALRPCQN